MLGKKHFRIFFIRNNKHTSINKIKYYGFTKDPFLETNFRKILIPSESVRRILFKCNMSYIYKKKVKY